jgi:hypothetical protein
MEVGIHWPVQMLYTRCKSLSHWGYREKKMLFFESERNMRPNKQELFVLFSGEKKSPCNIMIFYVYILTRYISSYGTTNFK